MSRQLQVAKLLHSVVSGFDGNMIDLLAYLRAGMWLASLSLSLSLSLALSLPICALRCV
jgi:hypothetical protein